MIPARRLDGALDRLGAGIAEKHAVGEGRAHKALAQGALAGDLEDVGDMPELVRLRLQRAHDLRVRVAEHVHRYASHEVEVARPLGRVEPRPLTSLKGQGRPLIGLKER